MRRARRPGLLGTAAQTAVIAGTAQTAAGRVARRQQENAAQQHAAAAAPVPAASPAPAQGSDVVAQLEQLSKLHDSDALTTEQFEAAKTKLLS